MCPCRHIEEHLPPEFRDRCYFFSSFFYKKLTEKQKQPAPGKQAHPVTGESMQRADYMDYINHERVKKWTKVRREVAQMHALFATTVSILANTRVLDHDA